MQCRLCHSEALEVGELRVLERHQVHYYQCPTCDLIQTETPTWLDEAYSTAMASLDTGAIERNFADSAAVDAVMRVFGYHSGLDYGGGHGVFTRSMRDHGHDYRWLDKFADNIYARGFECEEGARYPIVSAFEVVEHFVDPAEGFAALFAHASEMIMFTTELHSGRFDPQWGYLYPDTGQHVAFYSQKTFDWIAANHSWHYKSVAHYRFLMRQPHTAKMRLLWPLLRYRSLCKIVSAMQRPRGLACADQLDLLNRIK